MWKWHQLSGTVEDDSGVLRGAGYSGFGFGRNFPPAQDKHDVGPIPRGEWKITELLFETPEHGPYVLRLEPVEETETFGRAGFLIHGDSIAHKGSASKGCIILDRPARERIWMSGDHQLTVVE